MKNTKAEANRWKVYATSLSCLGIDITPKDSVPDNVACVDTATTILRLAGIDIPYMTYTPNMFRYMDEQKTKFKRVTTFEPGNIIISPTGFGNGKLSNGHVGIIGFDEEIMSNDSSSGLFVQNYTVKKWAEFYRGKGGFPIYVFKPL